MPPQLQALLQNRRMLIIVGGALVAVLVILIVLLSVFGGKKVETDPGELALTEEQLGLAEGVSGGKAVEIRALLARQGIRMNTTPGTGGTVSLSFPEETTLNERDQALLTIAQSGLMDGKLGMEAFDKSDMMASREEKQIKLIRAQEGELARIIRKMPPVEDAHVKISVPDPTLFASDRRPPSAAVQVTLPPNERLTRDKVRAIINLMVGAVQSMEAKHVALSDTNGNTYNSVLDSSMELQDKAAEQDFYMKQKISAQLDKLIGAGHYVVTVSTFLREAPRETMVQNFDPAKSAVANKQRFQEKLKDGRSGNVAFSHAGGPVSGYLPPELDSKVAIEKQVHGDDVVHTIEDGDGGYLREGTEVRYQNGHTQWVETSLPGMVEDISVAVTVDDAFYPNVPPDDLQLLIARAASPRVNPANVTLARTDFENPQPLEGEEPLPEAPTNVAGFTIPGLNPELASGMMTWLPWMAISLIGALAVFFLMRNNSTTEKNNSALESTLEELQHLRQHAEETQQHLEYQQKLNQQLMDAQQQQHQVLEQNRQHNVEKLQQALQKLQHNLSGSEGVSPPSNANPATRPLNPEDLDIESWLGSPT
jgi:flagellar M-ring protein FliF